MDKNNFPQLILICGMVRVRALLPNGGHSVPEEDI